MLPSVSDLISEDENCYSFVVGIAKRARKIAEKANDEGVILDEKPVKLAVNEYVSGKFRVVPRPAAQEENKEENSSAPDSKAQ